MGQSGRWGSSTGGFDALDSGCKLRLTYDFAPAVRGTTGGKQRRRRNNNANKEATTTRKKERDETTTRKKGLLAYRLVYVLSRQEMEVSASVKYTPSPLLTLTLAPTLSFPRGPGVTVGSELVGELFYRPNPSQPP